MGWAMPSRPLCAGTRRSRALVRIALSTPAWFALVSIVISVRQTMRSTTTVNLLFGVLRIIAMGRTLLFRSEGPLGPRPRSMDRGGEQHVLQDLELLQALTATDDDGVQRVVGDDD